MDVDFSSSLGYVFPSLPGSSVLQSCTTVTWDSLAPLKCHFLKTVSEGNSHFHLASSVTRLYHVGSAAFPLGQMFCLLQTPSMIVHTGFKKKQQEVNQKASKELRHGSGFLFNFHIYIHFLNKILKF